jgi:putative acetyltransferase
MALEVVRTDSGNPGFAALVKRLDEDLAGRYGELQKSYAAYNQIENIKDVVVIYSDGTPAACGAFKEFSSDTVEMKRVFVPAEYRRQGLARLVMRELEALAGENGYRYAVLETGVKQVEAIGLYQSIGYETIANYAQYAGNANSVCMKKEIKQSGSH